MKDGQTDLVPGQVERLDYADRWMRSGLEACPLPGFFLALDADMTGCRRLIDDHRARGTRITYTSLFVYAVAQALARQPQLHRLVSGSRRCRPGRVNIALSVAGGACAFVAPVLVIPDAASRSPAELTEAITVGAPRACEEQRQLVAALRRWGWLLPFAALRRAMMRRILSREIWKNCGEAPAFQVTGLPDVDQVVPMLLLTTGILGVGQVKEKPVCVAGEVRSALRVTLSCCVDHRVWDGQAAALFLNEVKAVLERIGDSALRPPVAEEPTRRLGTAVPARRTSRAVRLEPELEPELEPVSLNSAARERPALSTLVASMGGCCHG